MVKLSKIQLLSASVLLALAMVVFFGPVHTMGMDVNENGQMGGCIFIGNVEEACIMSISEHLSAWARLFSFVPNDFIKVLLTIASLFILYFFCKKYVPHLRFQSQLSRIRFYILYWSNVFSLTPLRQAFATGILNPKIF